MTSVKPKYLIALAVVVVFAVGLKVLNPNKKFSTREFWQSATLESVSQVPEKVLRVGNKNGSVLMWAAMGTSDPRIIRALVERGADVNEPDPVFSGTPLTAAAGYGHSPEIIKELVNLGADVNRKVNNDETALLIAAQYNATEGIIEALASAGANLQDKTAQGMSALDLAKKNGNETAERALKKLMGKN